MNIFSQLLIFRVDAIAIGIAQGLIIREDFDKAWEVSFLLAQKKNKKNDCLNFAEAIFLCTEILTRSMEKNRLKNVAELYISSKCRDRTLREEGEKLVRFLKAERMNELAVKLQKSLE